MTVSIIGWALLSSIWQGAFIAVLLAGFLALTRRSAPAVRYWAGLIALAAMAVLPVATAFRVIESGGMSPEDFASVPISEAAEKTGMEASAGEPDAGPTELFQFSPVSSTATGNLLTSLRNSGERLMPWMVALWFTGLLLCSLRLLGGLVRTRRLTRRGAAEASEAIAARVRALAAKLDVTRAVKVLESTRSNAPLVVGALRPVIVLPVSLLTGLTPIQLDMLLAHELAHIRRHDFAINLVQTIIETLLFYHPAARWVSSRIREERENCCDDIAIEVSGGQRAAYAGTLLALEERRGEEYVLAAAATGGSLVKRVRRIVLGEAAHLEIGPRWIAGLVTLAAALFAGREAVALGVHSALIPGYRIESPADTTGKEDRRPDPARAAPSTVLRAPSGGTLEERWRWAEQRGGQLGGSYWVGYVVPGDPAARSLYYASDVPVHISNGSIQMSGSMRFVDDDLSGITFSGVSLAPLVGAYPPRSTVLLFQVSQGLTGRRIERTHVASFRIPAYFFARPLIWLNEATDAESIAKIRSLASNAASDVRSNLVGAIGAHSSDELVLPVLSAFALSGSDPEEVRQAAVESLARLTGASVISTLSRVARTDRSTEVRREAIAAFSHIESPGATDSLIGFSRTALTGEERRAAIEAIGDRGDSRALKFLTDLAHSNVDSRIRRDAIEALGSMPDERGIEPVERIARSGISPESRRAAVEAIGSWNDVSRALRVLDEIARNDQQEDVRVAAVEALASVDDARSVMSLRNLANAGETEAVRAAAIEALGNTADDAAAVTALRTIAETAPSENFRVSAMETLAGMQEIGAEYIAGLIRGNARDELRLQALEAYADNAGKTRAIGLLRSVVLEDRSEMMRVRALELLEDVGESGMNAIRELARTSTSPVIRERAREILSNR